MRVDYLVENLEEETTRTAVLNEFATHFSILAHY